MGDKTHIAWCDSTWNWVRGCEKVSPGCKNCYAEKLVNGRLQGAFTERTIASDRTFNAPLWWDRKPWVCEKCGEPQKPAVVIRDTGKDIECVKCGSAISGFHRRRVFSLSLGDWLDPKIPVEVLAWMLDIIRRCQNLDFLLLTKRPQLFAGRMERAFYAAGNDHTLGHYLATWIRDWWAVGKPPPNVWIGTSVEDQPRADERIPELLKIQATLRFLSVEPLLGPINLTQMGDVGFNALAKPGWIDWIIVGGESGQRARPCNIEWIRSVKDQCKSAGVACFVKQLGSNPIHESLSTIHLRPSHPKGGDMKEFPEDLKIREFPK